MTRSNRIRIISWMFVVITKEVEGAVSSPPSNTVADVNGEAIFNCTATPSGPLAWVLTRDGIASGEIRIAAGCVVTVGLQNHYRTEQPGGPTTCSLIVFDITMEQAGVYHCTDSDTYRALLTVLDSSSNITFNNTQGVIENEDVVVTCTLNHNGSVSPAPTLRPHYYWTDINGQNVTSSYDSSMENKAVSQLTVTAGRQDIAPYTCHVYLELYSHATSGYAVNTPTVNNTARSPTITVLYSPSLPQLVVTPTGFVTCEAKNLTCYSDANPSPNYNWVDITFGNVTDAQKIVAEYGVNYTCNASNVIRNDVYVNSSPFYETPITNNTCKFPRATNMHISGQSCNEYTCTCECSPATILCYVDSYPLPSYEWLLPDGSLVEGHTVEAIISGIFVCRSYTLIDGWYLVEAYKSINVSGCYFYVTTGTTSDSTENDPECTNSSAETAAIVLGVLLAISITFHMICFLLLYRRGVFKRSDSSLPEVSKPNSNSGEPQYQDLFKETLSIGPEYEELRH